MVTTPIGFIFHFIRSVEIAVSEKYRLADSDFYRKDLALVKLQLLADVYNGYQLQLFNAF